MTKGYRRMDSMTDDDFAFPDGRQAHDCRAWTVKQVAEALHVSQPTVREWLKRGDLPSVLVGKVRRVLLDDLRRFIMERRTFSFRAGRNSTCPPPPEEPDPEGGEGGHDDIVPF